MILKHANVEVSVENNKPVAHPNDDLTELFKQVIMSIPAAQLFSQTMNPTFTAMQYPTRQPMVSDASQLITEIVEREDSRHFRIHLNDHTYYTPIFNTWNNA